MKMENDIIKSTSVHISAVCNPKYTWECILFGLDNSVVLQRTEEQVPNWFWRQMQYLILGNKWRKLKGN